MIVAPVPVPFSPAAPCRRRPLKITFTIATEAAFRIAVGDCIDDALVDGGSGRRARPTEPRLLQSVRRTLTFLVCGVQVRTDQFAAKNANPRRF